MSKITKLVSSKSIIGELFSDFNINQTDFLSKVSGWIAKGIDMMELEGYYALKARGLKLEEGRVPLPCDIKYLGVVLIQEYGYDTTVQSSSANSFPYDLDANNLSLNQYSRLPLRESFIYGTKFSNAIRESTGLRGYINNNWLYVNGDIGHVVFVYFAPSCDADGFPMIVDDVWVKEALPFYIIYRMSLSGWKHPVINMDTAYEQWNKLYPRARNSVNFPDIEEMQQITEMNNNPLLGDLGNQLFMY